MKGPFGHHGIEGPAYADRVGGRLTFSDWEHWTKEDREEYRDEFKSHCTGMNDDLVIFEFTHKGERFEVFERGYVKVTPSQFPADANIVINRIPRMILSYGARALEAK